MEPVTTTIATFAGAAVLGGICYDALKCAGSNATTMIKDKIKGQIKNWVFDDQQTEQIIEQVTQLGLDENEDQQQYQQRIFADQKLQQLLNITTSTIDNSINQTMTNSPGGIQAGGSVTINR
jgi:hypothetical protein